MSKCDWTNYRIIFTEWVRNPREACLVRLLSRPSSWARNKTLSEMGSYCFLSDEIDLRIVFYGQQLQGKGRSEGRLESQ